MNHAFRAVAFREARLKSERLRIRIFLGVAGAAFLLRTFRAVLPEVQRTFLLCS
jgi:uncharacterized membrane protein SirB2